MHKYITGRIDDATTYEALDEAVKDIHERWRTGDIEVANDEWDKIEKLVEEKKRSIRLVHVYK